MSDIFKIVSEFELRLSISNGFYTKLLTEDDWSFIIKLSALFEAACTHTLVAKLRTPELEESLSYLEQANSKYGKIKLLKNLGSIYPDQANFLEKLASLRNRFAHDISNVSLTFAQLVAQMDSNQKKTFVVWAGHGIVEKATIGEEVVSRYDFVLSNPKVAIWLTAAEILAYMYLEVEFADYVKKSGIYYWLKAGQVIGSDFDS